MSTTSIAHNPGHPAVNTRTYRDPACRIRAAGHVCARRDGRPLTGPDQGDCHAQAAIDAKREALDTNGDYRPAHTFEEVQ